MYSSFGNDFNCVISNIEKYHKSAKHALDIVKFTKPHVFWPNNYIPI